MKTGRLTHGGLPGIEVRGCRPEVEKVRREHRCRWSLTERRSALKDGASTKGFRCLMSNENEVPAYDALDKGADFMVGPELSTFVAQNEDLFLCAEPLPYRGRTIGL